MEMDSTALLFVTNDKAEGIAGIYGEAPAELQGANRRQHR